MTDLTLDAQFTETSLGEFSQAIDRAIRNCDQIVDATRSVQRNLNWLKLHGSEALILLDFDIVYAALPSVALGEYLHSGVRPKRTATLLNPVLGPRELRALLSRFEKYTLAPGATSELLQKRREITAALKRKSAGFLEMLNVTGGTHQFSQELLRALTLHDLWDELQRFIADLEDADFLEQLLVRCIPYKDIVKRDIPSGEKTPFDACMVELTRRRPDRAINNFNDALNVAAVVQLFADDPHNALLPVLIFKRRRSRGLEIDSIASSPPEQRHFPIFLTTECTWRSFRTYMNRPMAS
jgi:hypothetical protein